MTRDDDGTVRCAFTLRGTRYQFAWGDGSFGRV
jgi:hypothetical protein